MAIDYAIHLTARYREELGKGQTPATAAPGAVFSVGGALVLATITTVIGFLTNVVSPLPPIRDFGVFVAAVLARLAAQPELTDPMAQLGFTAEGFAPDADVAALYDLAREVAPQELASVITADGTTAVLLSLNPSM